MYVLFTDTDIDITLKEANEYGIHLISMPYSVDGNEIYPYKDYEEFDSAKFYNMLRSGTMPKTSGLSCEQYLEYFEPYFKEGKDILYVHFSRAMSGTFEVMETAQKMLEKKYPNRKLYTIDSVNISIGGANFVKEVCDLYRAGKTIQEIMDWAKKGVEKFAMYFFATDLKFFAKSGRIKGFKAFMGNLLGVKPIINMSMDGLLDTIGTVRGKNATINKILDYVDELQEDILDHRVIIGHSDCRDVADLIAEKLKERYGNDLRIEFVDLNPTIGSHCGPDVAGVSFHSKHR